MYNISEHELATIHDGTTRSTLIGVIIALSIFWDKPIFRLSFRIKPCTLVFVLFMSRVVFLKTLFFSSIKNILYQKRENLNPCTYKIIIIIIQSNCSFFFSLMIWSLMMIFFFFFLSFKLNFLYSLIFSFLKYDLLLW